jgi:hypothetical protein
MAIVITPTMDLFDSKLNFNHLPTTKINASTFTADIDFSGMVHEVFQDCVITLPAVAPGAFFIFKAARGGVDITLSPAAADRIIGGGSASTPADDKDLQMLQCNAGDWIMVAGSAADGYAVVFWRYTGHSTVTYLA